MMEMNPVGKESERFFGNVDVPDGGYIGKVDGPPNMVFDHDTGTILLNDTLVDGICNIVRTQITPATMTVNTGTLTSGTVADVQDWADGNSVNVTEVTGVPGYDVEFKFTNVADFCFVGCSAYYTGSQASHYAQLQVFDDANAVWRTLWTFSGDNSFNYRFSDLPVSRANRADYINGSNEVLIRYYHPTTGNNSHNLFVNLMSIIGRRSS